MCAVVCAAMFSFEASAQDQEILRLKDGTEIVGVIERLSNGGARVTDVNGDTFVFTADEIALITNAEQKARQEKAEKKRSGYAGIVQAGIGYSLDGGVHFTAGMINAWKVNPWFYIGAGLDLGTSRASSYSANANGGYGGYVMSQEFIMPFYFHLRYSILGGRLNNKISPYVSFNVGSDIMHIEEIIFEPSVGVQIKNLSIGDIWVGLDIPISLGSIMDLCIKVGWSF